MIQGRIAEASATHRPRRDFIMLQARIHRGRIEVEDPIPKEWEGLAVKILPLTPEDPLPDLEERLAALAALGPMELEKSEREFVDQMMGAMDRLSREAMQRIATDQP